MNASANKIMATAGGSKAPARLYPTRHALAAGRAFAMACPLITDSFACSGRPGVEPGGEHLPDTIFNHP
jgi:hypothetical protein